MIALVGREGASAFDKKWIDAGVPSLLLMENAGRGAADLAAAQLLDGTPAGKQVVVVCGTGNNGGDGLVVARRLRTLGASVRVLLVGAEARFTHEASVQARAYRALGSIEPFADFEAELVVDALFGTGLSRALEGEAEAAVLRINASGAKVLALDLPSGLDANTGVVHGACVRATRTATFGYAKTGLYTPRGSEHAGCIDVLDIGVPQDQSNPAAWLVGASDARSAVRRRAGGSYKNSNGHVLVVGGSPGKTGAPQLAGYAALRAGAGLVTVATWPSSLDALSSLPISCMRAPLDLDALAKSFEGMRAVVAGPGLGTGADAGRVFVHLCTAYEGAVVFDADAFTWAAKKAYRFARKGPTVLTPHPAELARILDRDTQDIEANRMCCAREAADATGAVVVLKGAHTVVAAPNGTPIVSPHAQPALAVAGSGDTLAGIVGALLGAGYVPEEAAWLGVWLHGEAARLAVVANANTDRGLLPTEFADQLPALFGQLA